MVKESFTKYSLFPQYDAQKIQLTKLFRGKQESGAGWETIVKTMAAIAAANLGGKFVAAVGMGLGSTIIVVLLSSAGAFLIVDSAIDMVLRGHERFFVIAAAIAVVGAVVVIFAGGGALATTVGALALVGTVGSLVWGMDVAGWLSSSSQKIDKAAKL